MAHARKAGAGRPAGVGGRAGERRAGCARDRAPIPTGVQKTRGGAAVRQRQRGRRDRLSAPGARRRGRHGPQRDAVARRPPHGVVAEIRRRRREPPAGGPGAARRQGRDRAFLGAPVRAARHGGSRRSGRQPPALARHHRGRRRPTRSRSAIGSRRGSATDCCRRWARPRPRRCMPGPGTPKRTTSTSRASRSRATPGRTGRRSPCSSARARSIRTTRTRGRRSGSATTTRDSTAAVGAKRSGVRKRRSDRRWRWIRAISRPPCGLLGLQVDAGRLQDGYDSAVRLVARRPDSGEGHFALSLRPPLRRAAGGIRSRVRRGRLPRPDQSTVPVLLGDVHSARAIRSGARLRPPGLRFRVVAAGHAVRLPAAGPSPRCPRAAPSAVPGVPPRVGARELPRLHRALPLGRRPDRCGTVER